MCPLNNNIPDLKIAILGNPRVEPDWSPEKLQYLVDMSFNAIQLNVAWGCRPFDEPLNLFDVVTAPGDAEEPMVAARRDELKRRNAMAKKMGLRTIFHFGSPFMWRNPETGEVCRDWGKQGPDAYFDILNPKVVEHETALLREFRKAFPDVDDVLVYTYDQDAWQVSEFDESVRSRGIPLHERLPNYLKALYEVWTGSREGCRMWWEPWELSAGQIYMCISQLPRKNFGMMIHSNIAEVQIARPVDVWYRNTARMCKDLDIPVVGEAFFSAMTEEIEPLTLPCPRLVDEQYIAMTGVPGVVGIKEYFGIAPLVPDPNIDILKARLENPLADTPELLQKITARFGHAQEQVLRVLGMLADAIQLYPWDASWFAREVGVADIDHGWSAATVRGLMCETPSWRSTRYSHFMMTDDRQPHAFLLEDIGLRCRASAEVMRQAIDACDELVQMLPLGQDKEMYEHVAHDAEIFRRVVTSYALHLRETNIAQMLRGDITAGRPMDAKLADEMNRLLEEDAENQFNQGRVMKMKKLFAENPEAFLKDYLLPTEQTILEKGYHTLTTR